MFISIRYEKISIFFLILTEFIDVFHFFWIILSIINIKNFKFNFDKYFLIIKKIHFCKIVYNEIDFEFNDKKQIYLIISIKIDINS